MLTPNAIHVLEQRYLRKDISGKVIETPIQLFERVSKISKTPQLKKHIFNHLQNLDFLPNSPTLMNANTELGQLSACFVLSVEDSMSGIFDAVKHTAIIHKSGGGTGYNFSHLRPEGAFVRSTQGKSSGPLSFMNVFHSATDTVIQGGKRRGAMMGCLNCDHPDIIKFIHAKDKGSTLSNFNLSVVISDAFMNAVINNLSWELKFKDKVYQTLPARDIFNQIVQHAWESGDPGLLFIDTANRNNTSGNLFESTNPCGEQWLLPFESCNLASINLKNMLTEDKTNFDYDKIHILLKDLVPFMNDIIDANNFPLPEIKEATLRTRRIGIGVMGWADVLAILKIPYNSPDALKLAEEVMSTINSICHKISKQLNDGVSEFNQNLTTIAPTGTISVIANVSSGIEPIYAVAYKRNLSSTIGKDLYEVNPIFLEIAKSNNFYSETLISEIINNHGSIQSLASVPDNVKPLFLTAHDIHFEDHIKMQAIFQKHTDSAVSKTINMLESATPQNIYDAYMLAWKLGCKGITIYRDNSKNQQVLTTDNIKLSIKDAPTPRPRLKYHIGIMGEINTACGPYYNGITWDKYGMFEDFTTNSGRGGCSASQETIGRITSLSLRNNVPPDSIQKQLHKVKCTSCITKDEFYVNNKFIGPLSCADGISQMIKEFNGSEIEKDLISLQQKIDKLYNSNHTPQKELTTKSSLVCPNCHSTNISNDKCATCQDCGISRCL